VDVRDGATLSVPADQAFQPGGQEEIARVRRMAYTNPSCF
jgi:hypothetical protein